MAGDPDETGQALGLGLQKGFYGPAGPFDSG